MSKPIALVMIRGLPGTGKSTRAAVDFTDHLHFEPDQYCCDARGRYHFDPRYWDECQRFCLMQTDYALARGQSVVVADVFERRAMLQPYRELAKAHGATFDVITLDGDGSPGSHHVPVSVLARMRSEFEP